MSLFNAVLGASTAEEAAAAFLGVGVGLAASEWGPAVALAHDLGVAAEEALSPGVARAIHGARDQLGRHASAGNEEEARSEIGNIGRLIRESSGGWPAWCRLLAPDGSMYHPSREARISQKEIELMRLCPKELTLNYRKEVVRTLRDHCGLISEEVRWVLEGMIRDKYSIEVWKKVPDTGHSPIALEMIQKYIPAAVGRSALLTRSPYFVTGQLAPTTGLEAYGEYDVLIRKMMLHHWEMFAGRPVRQIQLIHAMVYVDRELRLAFQHFPRSLEKMEKMARIAIGLSLRTIEMLRTLSMEERAELSDRWGLTGLAYGLAAVAGDEKRFERFRHYDRDKLDETYRWAAAEIHMPRHYGGLYSPKLISMKMLERFHLTAELLACYLDGLDPMNPEDREKVRERVRENLGRFAVGAELPAIESDPEPIEWPIPWIGLDPDPEQIHRGRQILKANGFYPGRIFELTAASFHRLIRGGDYTAIVLEDGRILVGLKTDETLLHLFMRMEETIGVGERISEAKMVEIRAKLRESLVGAPFEFHADNNGVPHLVNRSGTYRPPAELMKNVIYIFELKGLSYHYDPDRQFGSSGK